VFPIEIHINLPVEECKEKMSFNSKKMTVEKQKLKKVRWQLPLVHEIGSANCIYIR